MPEYGDDQSNLSCVKNFAHVQMAGLPPALCLQIIAGINSGGRAEAFYMVMGKVISLDERRKEIQNRTSQEKELKSVFGIIFDALNGEKERIRKEISDVDTQET